MLMSVQLYGACLRPVTLRIEGDSTIRRSGHGERENSQAFDEILVAGLFERFERLFQTFFHFAQTLR